MSGPSASRPNDPTRPLPPAAESMPDPWGVRRAENLLTSLEGVLSARVVTTPLGEVSEVHILAQAGLPAKQLVRNIESALLAQLGLRVDHRKISIAQTADVKPIETLDRHAVRERSLMRAVLFEGLTVQPGRRPQRSLVQVALTCGGKSEGAEEEAADTMRGRVEAAAKATVAVLDRLLNKGSMLLEGARVIQALDREVVFVTVQAMNGRDSVLLTGTAEVRQSPERAAVLAVLDATNRWSELRRMA
ncbi:MAG TPA: hypothetical protein VIP80_03440 [Gemmatimonadales bacterium]